MTTRNQKEDNIVDIANSNISVIYTRSSSFEKIRTFNIKKSTFDVANKRFIDKDLHDTEKEKDVNNLLYCASVVDFYIDSCSYLCDNSGIRSGFANNDTGAMVSVSNSRLQSANIIPHYNCSFKNCEISLPPYFWVSICCGHNIKWEDNIYKTNENKVVKVEVTEVKKGKSAMFTVSNYIGAKIPFHIVVNDVIKDRVSVIFNDDIYKL